MADNDIKYPIVKVRFSEVLWQNELTAQELADKAQVSKSSISQYINGKNSPSNFTAKKIADCLKVKVNPAWLMGLDVEKQPQQEKTVDIDYLEKSMELLDQEQLQRLKCYAEYLLAKNKH